MVDVPAVVRNKAIAVGAENWLDGLDDLLADLEAQWRLDLGAPFADGTEAYVVAATTADGTPAVLKLLIPRDGNAARHEITVMRLANGTGCAALYRSDVERGALLMERLGPSLVELDRPVAERHRILCDVAAALWRPAPECDLPTGADKACWLMDHITALWHELDRPCASRTVDLALAAATRRIEGHDDGRARLVHGDVHAWNTLQASDGFKLVDPDGLLAEPEYDLGVIMREDPAELTTTTTARHRAERLGRRTGLNVTAIWEWGVIERVSTGLLLTKIDLQPVGRQMLAVADMIARDE